MNSESKSDVNKTVDALIALAFKTVEEDQAISEEEIAKFLSADIEPPPSYEAAVDPLGPDLMQRMIAAETEVRTQSKGLDGAGVLQAIREKLKTTRANDSKQTSANILAPSFVFQILPGIRELLGQLELALAAAEPRPALRDYVCWTRDKQTKLVLRLGASANFTISVWDAAGQLSDRLNDSEILDKGGSVIAKIVAGSARAPARLFENGFAIRDPSGKALEVDLQS